MGRIRDRSPDATRRRVLAAGAAVASGAFLGAAAPAAAQSGTDFGGWFDGVSNYDGVVDRTGQSEVTVEVGVENGGGPYGFGPPAVRVDSGTTVVWQWTGQGGSHNVVAQDGSYESELVADAGRTFSHTFESEGVSKYFCQPHKAIGMKGAIVVGGSGGSGGGSVSEPDFGGWFEGVSNYSGTVDKRGQSEVTVEVGVENGGGPYGFGPASVRVDPGTTVVWQWTGQGGSHNVVAQDGSYSSELVAEAGHSFSHTFESEGVSKYFCQPHKALGMKGAIVVGNVGGSSGGSGSGGDGGGAAADSGGGLSLLVPDDFTGWLAVVFGGTVGLAVTAVLGSEAYTAYRDHAAAEEAYVRDSPVEAVEDDAEVELGEEYDPVGTAALVFGYFVLISALWVFMYFVEYIGGPTITG
ncbi:halocyanin domain-containing protein [Halobaculum gomorrense]|uniref:Halocyanin domain-containing protein n=1 Tax=Halobaculum gomorrense TaxID=43928 RepID=A0A1M5NXQ2_9EURY|nr:halocyanin domain-containing protein [Halobaculum gomorrense]SHG94292.1 halocyanin domain-containing protein [Halobaculum gomorrense]